jgi:hypothetical protein
MLSSLADPSRTDKNTTHSYLDLYDNLLRKKKESALNVLEIGIWHGGSIKLWNDYFTIANIYAIDIMHINDVWDNIKNNERIILYTSTNAYDIPFFKSTFFDNNIKFDFILDDGPHTLESMIQFIILYSQIMTDDGILIIEDVKSIEWTEYLRLVTPTHLKKYIEVYDLRTNKNQHDDILFVINLNNKND